MLEPGGESIELVARRLGHAHAMTGGELAYPAQTRIAPSALQQQPLDTRDIALQQRLDAVQSADVSPRHRSLTRPRPWIDSRAPSSRQDEYEADAYASALLVKAGLGTAPQKDLFRKLASLTGMGGRGAPAWLMSHPKSQDRIAAIEANEARWGIEG